jgi:hypothetical protein
MHAKAKTALQRIWMAASRAAAEAAFDHSVDVYDVEYRKGT